MRDGDVMDGGPAGAGDPVAPVKIYEIRTYQGPGGTIIQSRTDIFGSGREFYATCVWPVEVPGGAVQAQASFEVPGANVVDAFGNFAAASQAAHERAKADVLAQMNRKKIITAPPGMKLHNSDDGRS
jgi:hypothetical protein